MTKDKATLIALIGLWSIVASVAIIYWIYG